MRIRATVAAVSGALVLSAVAAPLAQADDSRQPVELSAASEAAHAATGKSAYATAEEGLPYALDATFSNVKVGTGGNIKVGTTNIVKVPVSFTLTHGADVDIHAADFFAGVELYRGASFEESIWWYDSNDATCTDTSATAASCKATVEIDPYTLLNEDAGAWKAAAFAVAFNGEDPENPVLDNVGVAVKDYTNSFNLQRYSKLTVNASPEPVKKGKTITVSGKLTRASWDSNTYVGMPSGQSVTLQFRKKGTTTYSNVKGIKTLTGGALKTTVTASTDGYYRFVYKGITSTAPVNATGDFIDVQ
ncbi:hypothetical protein STRCI_003734 [Streptomyces cinnabarinus]|uniref:Calcium-binding protein n=1 Tax=Streptomyces cinnabarinus TaxID=67287 RepID=A0ABY7KDQ6_9ACTN|nr:hypothetical protein [Streptomyces cinnabarinus]WAZ22479.1 hypothetical protein STRCI_003734 [Streptomyces cinnabarinus]